MSKKTTCQTCGKQFLLGYNGTCYGCDSCTGVRRDNNGYAWFPDELEATFEDVKTGEVTTVKRPPECDY